MDIWVKVQGPEIHYLNRILESYEYLGVLTTLDSKKGVARIRTTPDVYQEVFQILNHLPIQISYSLEASDLFSPEKV